jgi:hypothetical protein
MSANINEIRDERPEYMLAVILFEEYIQTAVKKTGSVYKTTPMELVRTLAACTARRVGWSALEEKRISWWRTFFENVRSVRADGSFGGGDSIRIKTCIDYYLNPATKQDARTIAYRAFYKNESINDRLTVLGMMNLETEQEFTRAEGVIGSKGLPFPSFTRDLDESQPISTVDMEDLSNADLALQLSDASPERWAGDEREVNSPSWAQFISDSFVSTSSSPLISVISNTPLQFNRILYGAPGTGKSFRLEEERTSISGSYERVTFYPEYGYAEFIGTYRPLPIYSDDGSKYTYENGRKVNAPGSPHVIYQFEPGIFIKILKKAYDSIRYGDDLTHLLLIEEINRTNVSATFGEIFQLLDRDEFGNSMYGVSMHDEILRYLSSENEPQLTEIRIPGNLYLWATMNTTDDGVYPMDSAFKRRWSFEHIGIDDGEEKMESVMLPTSIGWLNGISWNQLRCAINDKLRSQIGQFREDQLLGPFFFKIDELSNPLLFKNKLLDYLHQHVLRHNPSVLFLDEYTSASFSKLNRDFESRNVFKPEILTLVGDGEE